ncbi:uncharacterized protein LOC125759592 [Rhipicephalus sanguineus]|uniref:uncharacterized protein LOC125759592 n=1 Tax=Rhipicephalus sanguineus TaxID=34632 RepID=UPI0020C1FF98|nr:uncharacterized protein LOC125759592 [Rhipicephalus sanguineus]
MALLHEVDKTGLSIPLAMSFSLKGVYYTPMFADPSAPKTDEFQLFKPCTRHREPFYEDPKVLCTQSGWISNGSLPLLAYNMGEKKTITYLTEATIAQLACNAKQLNLNLKFSLVAYDVDFDQAPPCHRLGFAPAGGPFTRINNMREVMNFILTSYTSAKENFNCQLVAISIG